MIYDDYLDRVILQDTSIYNLLKNNYEDFLEIEEQLLCEMLFY